jgi:hypothetical protein
MKSQTLIATVMCALTADVSIQPLGLTAQQNDAAQTKNAHHHHYQFIDLGTFGGPASYFSNGNDGILNSQGTAAGWAREMRERRERDARETRGIDPFPQQAESEQHRKNPGTSARRAL